MSTATPAAKKAAAARAERNGHKSCEWRGLVLKLPPKLPASMLFEAAELEDAETLKPMFRFIESILGPEQFVAWRDKVNQEEIPLDEFDSALGELLEAIFDQYGVSLGG